MEGRPLASWRVEVQGTTTTRTPQVAGVYRQRLIVGQNYLSMPFDAGGGTLAEILPPALLPAGSQETAATTVSFWDPATQSLTSPYWNSSVSGSTGWRQSGSMADANGVVVDRTRGMVVTLRSSAGARTMYLAGYVATAATYAVTVKAGGYTLAAMPYAGEMSLGQSGLLAAGFQGGTSPTASDQLLFFSPTTGAFTTRIWYDTGSAQWRDLSSGNVSTKRLTPGEPVLIRRRGATDLTWTMARPYPQP